MIWAWILKLILLKGVLQRQYKISIYFHILKEEKFNNMI